MENKINVVDLDTWNQEEEELDEFGNPIDPSFNENIFGEYSDYIPFSDVISDSVKAAKTAYSGALASDETLNLGWGKLTEDKIEAFKKAQEDVETYGQSDEALIYGEKVEQYKKQGDSGLLSGIKAMMDTGDPGGYLVEIMAGSIAGMVGSAVANPALMSAGTSVGAGGGAATSAAATALATGWTGPIGAGLTAIAAGTGAVSGGFLGARSTAMGIMETSTTFADELKRRIIEKGGDPTNSTDIRAIMEDPEAVSDMQFKAAARGATIASIEAVSGGIAGSVGAKIAKKGMVAFQAGNITRSQLARTGAKALATSTVIEGIGGSLGEAAGMVAAGQELAGDEILLEGIAGTVMAPASLGASLYEASAAKKNAPPSYTFNGEQTTKERMIEMVEAPASDFIKMKFQTTNDPEVQERINSRRSNILNANSKEVITKEAAEENRTRIQPSAFTEEFINSQKEKQKLQQQLLETEVVEDPNLTQAIREKIISIDEKEVKASDEIVGAITDLSPNQGAKLMELNDSVSVYQDIVKDVDQPNDIKAVAFEKLQELKKQQLDIFTAPMFKNVELADKAQSLYDERGVEALNSIVETQEGTIRSVAIKKLNSVPQFRRYDGDVDALASELRYGPEGVARLVETYNPESGVPIAAYIAQQLNKRVQRAASKVLSQDNNVDFNSAEAANLLVEEENDFEVKIGSRFLADQLKLPMSLIDKAQKIIPVGLQKAVNDLQDNKELTAKKRQALAKKAVEGIYNNQLVKDIKEEFGKNTKTKEDFSNYLNKNYRPLATAFIAQNAAEKGTGISKQWSMFPPTRSEFVDYYEGKDIPLDRKNRSQPISDRKDALAQAVSRQIAEDVRAEYLATNPIEAVRINEAANIDVDADKKIIIASAFEQAVKEESNSVKLQQFRFQEILANLAGKPFDALTFQEKIDRYQILDEYIESKFTKEQANTISGRNNIISNLNKIAELGYLSPSAVNSAKLANFGGLYLNEKTSDGKKQYLVQGEGKSSLDPNADLMSSLSSKSEGKPRVFKKLSSVPDYKDLNVVIQGSAEYEIAFNEGRLIPNYSKGSIFYSTTQPQLLKLIEKAEKNYESSSTREKKLKQVNVKKELGLKNGGSVNQQEYNKIIKENEDQVKENQEIIKQIILDFKRLYQDGVNPYYMLDVIEGLFKATTGGVKVSYGFKGFETGKHNEFREEHSPPVNEFIANLINGVFTMNEEQLSTYIDNLYKDAGQYLISVESDNKINAAGFKARVPFNSQIGNNAGLFRLVSTPGIDVNKIVLNNGNTIAQEYGAGLGSIKTNPDLEAFQKKVVEEKLNPTETIIASAMDDIYNEPANNKLSEEETIEALGAILMNNWNKDGKTNLNVITDPSIIEEILVQDGQSEQQAKDGVNNNHGFLYGNDIFINLKSNKGLETLLHEAGHLWNGIVRKASPEVWSQLVNKTKESGLFAEYLEKIKKIPTYNKIVEDYENGINTYKLEDEVIARILEDYSAKKGFKTGNSFDKIKDLVQKYFTELANILGFDPTTKNLADLSIREMLELAVSEVVSGDPLSNFSKLKDSEGKTWFRKMKANVDPSFKVSIDPEYQGLKAVEEIYKTNGENLLNAIRDSYAQVKNIMSLPEWSEFIANTYVLGREFTPAEKALLTAKENVKSNETARLKKIKALKDANSYVEEDQNKTSEELDKKIKEVQDEAIKEEKEKAASDGRAEGLNRNFRRIINSLTGRMGRPSKWFIPPNAEDIKGLLYAFLPGGKLGNEAKRFFKSTILDPYSKGVAAAEVEILAKTKQFAEIMKDFKSDLKEVVDGTPYSKGQAIKVYNWIKNGVEVDIEKQSYIDALVNAVENDPELKALADQIEQNFPIDYKATWRNDTTINKSIYDAINSGTRARHLETFAENVDNIFNKDNMQEIENLYGKKFRQALQNSLQRMKTGRNRVSTDAQSNAFLNWINRAVATTMFVNTRSAVLQLLSSLNFIGKPNNNIFQATAAMFSDGWKKDFNTLWNSDYLKNRREGAKFDVLADEMSEGDVTGLNKILKFGFLPTRMADSFAIALGGAAFYRNTMNALIAGGMSKADAKAEAMKQWQGAAEESQQSSDPSKISEIQSSAVGKVVYAFANTPFQYARIVKRKLQDVVSGRSAAEGGGNQIRQDLQSVLYYSVGQAMLFNALQTALFAVAFEDDEDEKEKLMDAKTILSVERALTSYAKSLGNPGAVVGAIYSVIAEANEQQEKYGKIDNPYKIALEATAISPPLNTKLKDIVAIGNIYKYNEKEIKNDPFKFSPDNKALEIVGNAASFVGVPLDRVIRKAQNLSAIANEESEAWQKLFLALGWSKWELGLQQNKSNKKNFNKSFNKNFNKKFDTPFNKTVLNKNLPKNVVGRANDDGTIELDPSLKGKEKNKVIAHEKQHQKDMESGKLGYDDDFVYYNGSKHERKSGKIEYNGKKYMEGHPKLPWEAAANKVEKQIT